MLSIASCINDDSPDGEASKLLPGDTLPSFTIDVVVPSADWTAKGISTADLKGKPSLLVFFNTNCPDCQAELPVIQQLYTDLNKKMGVDAPHIIAISRAESLSSVEAYWKNHELSIPFSAQDNNDLYLKFANHTIPHIFVSNSQLIIQAVWTDNPLPSYDEIYKSLTEFL